MSGLTIDPSQLLTTPWIPPPPGIVSDFNDHSSIQPTFTGISITTLIIAILVLAARFYVKIAIQKKLWLDDACLLCGLIFQCAFIGIVIGQLYPIGLGQHGWNLPLLNGFAFANAAHYLAIISMPDQMFVTWGLLFFYLQIFSVNKVVRLATYFMIPFVFVVYFIPMVLFEVYKDVTKPLNIQVQLWTNNTVGILNLLVNIIVFSIPIFAVSGLQMSRSRKLGVIGIFATGLLAIIMSILALVYRVDTRDQLDIPYQTLPRFTVQTVELNVGIICACLPILPAIFKRKQIRSRLAPSKPTYARNPLNKNGSTTGLSSNRSNAYVELDEIADDRKPEGNNSIFVTREYHVSSDVQKQPVQMV